MSDLMTVYLVFQNDACLGVYASELAARGRMGQVREAYSAHTWKQIGPCRWWTPNGPIARLAAEAWLVLGVEDV